MSPDPESQKPPLAVDELARAVLELAAEPELGALVARFNDRIRGWAAPSALVAAVRGEGGGFRVLPALCFGSLPLGVERALEQLVEDLPECVVRPTLQQPAESLPGVKVRDNWVVPWWSEGQSGLLLLRGVPRPYPPNLGEALALVSAPVWPRLLGGPASRVQSLVDQLQQLSAQLSAEAGRELERLRAAAAAPPSPVEPAAAPAASTIDPAVVDRLELELRSAREQAAQAREEAAQARERAARVAAEVEQERTRTAGRQDEASRQAEETTGLRAELARQAEEAARLKQEAARLQEEHAAATERLRALEEQRGNVRVAEARARAAEEALAASQEALASHAGALRTEKAAALERIDEHRRALEAAEQRALEAEQALAAVRNGGRAATEQLESERSTRERAQEQLREAQAAEARARTAAEALSTQAADAVRELAAAREQMAAQQADEAALRDRVASAEQDRAEARQALEDARQGLEEARQALEEARAELSSTQSADDAIGVVRTALVALHRSAFVPAGLRFALEDVSAALKNEPSRRTPGTRVVILDRDLGGLETLASELEAAGIDVRIANYPEELALLLRTPGARELVAAICDVMAFRADQNIAGLFRSWEKEKAGLTFFLSYDPQSSVELERARRVPLSLTTAHLPRPLPAARVIEAIEALARRQARP